mgnify:CR=1 FL=1
MIDKYASTLLIGLTDDERKMIQEEFADIEKNMDLINEIPNIKDIEPLSYPFEMYIEDLRDEYVNSTESYCSCCLAIVFSAFSLVFFCFETAPFS